MLNTRFAFLDVLLADGHLHIWQQNLNMSLVAQLDLINNLHPSTVDILEPYFDHLRNTCASRYWTVVYPPRHKDSAKMVWSVLLVNNCTMSSNTWEPLPVASTDLTAIHITANNETVYLFNIYNDQKHSNTLCLLETETKKLMTASRN